MEPLISIQIRDHCSVFQPGDTLEGEYQIDAVGPNEIQAIEASVLWYTEGKGEEDMAVHYFERRVPGAAKKDDLRVLRHFATRLPNSPSSYLGVIVSIQWCVRVRAFLRGGKEVFFEQPFHLGCVSRAKAVSL